VLNLTADQTQWLLAFFGVVSVLLTYYALNLDKRMDKLKKDKKETRNLIKKNMEVQNVRPVLVEIFSMCSSKIDFEDTTKFEEELESLIFLSENWMKLDSEIRILGEKMKEISEVDNVFNKYIMYTSYFSKILFLLVFIIAAIIPVYVFGGLIAWVLWAIAWIQVTICLCIIKWKAWKASLTFDRYEDAYITK